jgi:hypothetical protein
VSTFITGIAGSGKTTELIRRALAAAQLGPVLVTSVAPAALSALRGRLDHPNAAVRELHEIALEALGDVEQIDDVRAAMLFADAAKPLLTLEWREIIEAQWDPEVPGLRSPERFLDAAFRLFCKLRDARISPEQFLESSLRGATQFYAKPPNFAHPDLLYYTKDTHRDSLAVDAAELQRQYRREVDLAKILAKLYRSYLDHPVRQGCLTPRDVIAQAADSLQRDTALAHSMRARYPHIFIDDAQELTIGELQLLQAVYGSDLDGATLAGDQDSATSTFRGARPDRVCNCRCRAPLAGRFRGICARHRFGKCAQGVSRQHTARRSAIRCRTCRRTAERRHIARRHCDPLQIRTRRAAVSRRAA